MSYLQIILFLFRCLSIIPKGSSYKFTNPSSSFQHNFSCYIRLSKFKQELSTKSFHLCCRSSAFASQYVGKSCAIPGFRHFSSHASKEQKSRKMLLYLTGLVFAMVGCTYAAVPLYRRFCQATGYGGTVTRREVCLSWFSMVFRCFINWVGNFTFFYLLITKICTFQTVEEKIARHDTNNTVTTRCCFFLIRCYIFTRASPGAAVKLCLGDLLVMGSNSETASLHMQG